MDTKIVRLSCADCGMDIFMTRHYEVWLQEDARRKFTCLKGHSQHFSDSENDIEKIRRERNLLKQQAAMHEDEIREEQERRKAAERAAAAQKGQVTRLKNRAKAGVCPCCNRSFQNLQRHMENKHPDFGKAESADTST